MDNVSGILSSGNFLGEGLRFVSCTYFRSSFIHEAAKQGKLHLQLGDCCALSYNDDTFTTISSINTIYFLE